MDSDAVNLAVRKQRINVALVKPPDEICHRLARRRSARRDTPHPKTGLLRYG
jgi:hypothetical protein